MTKIQYEHLIEQMEALYEDMAIPFVHEAFIICDRCIRGNTVIDNISKRDLVRAFGGSMEEGVKYCENHLVVK